MIPKLTKTIKYTVKEKKYINSVLGYKDGPWGCDTNEMKAIKRRVRDFLKISQNNFCAYCGGKLELTSRNEIEHIAPKHLYSPFSAHHKNLVLACSLCNGSSGKGSFDPVSRKSTLYHHCKFSIVHPYFDDPDAHYDWVNGVQVAIIGTSEKGKNSINLFGLADPGRTLLRAMQLQATKRKLQLPLEQAEQDAIDKALDYL